MDAAAEPKQVALGTFLPGAYHLTVISGGQIVLDADIVLALGSGPHVVPVPEP
jgi:hypothetical protein